MTMQIDAATYSSMRDWLAAAIRGERPGWPAAQAGAVERMLAVAEAEGVSALLDYSLRAPGTAWSLPVEFKDSLAAAARQQQVLGLLRRTELVRVVRVLAAAGIPALVLKGAALSHSVYPAPWLRPRDDTDLLLADTEAIECCKPVLAGLDYVDSKVPTTTAMAYELVFRRDTEGGLTHWIDAHWSLSNNAFYADRFSFDELRADAIALPALGADARGLGNVHALVHACMHRVCNLPHGTGDRLIWLYDMDLLARRCSARDFDRLCEIAILRGLAGTCWDGLCNSVFAFSTPLPHGLLDALERAAKDERFDVRKAGRRWYQEWYNLRTLPAAKRWSWAWEKLFPNPAYMRELYAIDNRWSLGWAYLHRLGHGMWMTLRGAER
jgi:hypothetical protein